MSDDKKPDAKAEKAEEAPESAPPDLHFEFPPGTPEEIERRRFLARVSVGLGACAGAGLVVPIVGFVVAPLFREEPREWRPVGRTVTPRNPARCASPSCVELTRSSAKMRARDS